MQKTIDFAVGFFIKCLTRKLVNDMLITRILVKMTKKLVKIWWGGERMPLLNRLKEYRARLGINQQELGKMVGASRQTISSIERGDYSPSIVLALKLAKICEASVEELFQYEEDETDEKNKF